MYAIKMEIDYSEEVIVLPLFSNLDGVTNYGDVDQNSTKEEILEAFNNLKADWESQEWGYDKYNKVTFSLTKRVYSSIEERDLVELNQQTLPGFPEPDDDYHIITNPDDVIKCTEFWGVWGFKEDMIQGGLYDTPWSSEPREEYFSSQFAYDCNYGRVYSKDFAYFHCEECYRDICEQNPSNGWTVQYRLRDDCYQICLKCYEEDILSNGEDVDSMLRNKTIKGSNFSNKELLDTGYAIEPTLYNVLVGMGYSGNQSPDVFFNELKTVRKEKPDHLFVCQLGSTAIGALGGYVTIWTKGNQTSVLDEEENKDESNS